MNVAGIDLSTFNVDIVTVPYDGPGQPVWHRFPLVGADAFDRARSVAEAVPGRSSVFWEDVLCVGIENPNARGPRAANIGVLYRVQGAVLARIPARMLVQPFQPAEWRRAVGLAGNATKLDVMTFILTKHQDYPLHAEDAFMSVWPQDAHDAHCIALATQHAITTQEAA